MKKYKLDLKFVLTKAVDVKTIFLTKAADVKTIFLKSP